MGDLLPFPAKPGPTTAPVSPEREFTRPAPAPERYTAADVDRALDHGVTLGLVLGFLLSLWVWRSLP